MAYTKRYAGGFLDKPTLTTAIDSAFLNAVEAALVELLSTDGSVDGQALQWIAAQSKFGPALLLNKNIDAAAAIDKSKLNLAGQLTNADVSGAAAIDRSKLNFGAGLVNADIAAAAAIASSKFADPVPRALYRKVTAKQVVNSVASTDLFNGEITIAAGAMGASGFLRITIFGDAINNTGSNQNAPTLTLALGGTIIAIFGALAGWASNAFRQPWVARATIANLGATNSQFSQAELAAVWPSAGITASTDTPLGFGYETAASGGVSLIKHVVGGATAVDTTAACALVFNTTNAVASASYDITLRAVIVEVI